MKYQISLRLLQMKNNLPAGVTVQIHYRIADNFQEFDIFSLQDIDANYWRPISVTFRLFFFFSRLFVLFFVC